MRSGADVIVQGSLVAQGWHGYADILQRVDRASELGAWSYEVADTKLSREPRGSTILQLAAYSDLVARVQGFLQSINYKDGAFVKEGTSLFTIEPDTYKLKLEQAQAAESGAQASVRQTEADFKRQQELVQRQAVSQATLDNSTSARDNAQANLLQAQVNTKIAAVNYGYTNVTAPFDGVVSAHLASVGELVGASSQSSLPRRGLPDL